RVHLYCVFSLFFFLLTVCIVMFFFFQAEDGIRDLIVTGVQTCALPISPPTTQASTTVQEPLEVERWWTTFNDPELDSLVRRAVRANLDIQLASERIVQARAV